MKGFDIDTFLERLTTNVADYVPNLIGGIVVLVIGLLVIKFFRRFMNRLLIRKPDMDPTLIQFLKDVGTWALRIVLLIVVINQLGVETTAFAAMLGAAGLAIGLSLQGSLSNFAGGVLIIVFKPFRVGEYVEVQGEGGTVNEIQILYTRLLTPNNQVVYIPNGALANGNIKNFSREPLRKEELIFGVAYGSNLKKVKEVINRVLENDDKVLKDPAPVIRVKTLGDSSVNFQVLLWATNENFWQMLSDVKEAVKNEFDKEGIEIPFPQRDINHRYPDKGIESAVE
ncbi:mechanosensitive ion channel family protein [Flavobacterium sp. RHBU_24]|uniref:mechanosensitive ion channel family protein n=1 Tax=Flavobacterium sp. RHBU_24 TaxID=3391185 RepID=UPI0039849ED8